MLRDVDGKEYIDLASGIGVMAVGHNQPAIVDAISSAARVLQHAAFQVATYPGYVLLAEKLARLFPHGNHTKVLLANSGAEAVENAVKIARQATGRSALICYTDAFHGRTLLGMSLTSKVGYKLGSGPFAPEVYRLPFPNFYKHGDGLNHRDFLRREIDRLLEATKTIVPAEDVAAIVIEPIQGEGGFNPCPPEYLAFLREFSDEQGILLIADEVQSGFGRTGRLAAYEHAGIVPDLTTFAKALGGGLPISAIVGSAEIMDAALPGTLGGTYGGNPIACAAALAAIELIESRELVARAERLGDRIRPRLQAIRERTDLVGDVRGLGAMLAMELVEGGDPRLPATEAAAMIVKRSFARGLLMIRAGTEGNVIRLLPPLVIEEADLDRALTILEEETLAVAGEQ